eukprot:2171738-Rhodomonas_salina.2
MTESGNNISIPNLTTNNTYNGNDTHTNGDAQSRGSGNDSNVSKTDPSLLHQCIVTCELFCKYQITSLQKENQDLLQQRREIESRLKDLETKMQEKEALHMKEKEQFIEVQKKEMEHHFKSFMQDWIASMEKENPEVIEKMKGGIDKLIEGGRNKDKMWEILCCASKTHKANVNTIEELTKTNNMLMERNKQLETIARTGEGYSNDAARIGKRSRSNDTEQQQPAQSGALEGGGSQFETTDCWGQFESLMSNNKNNVVYY